MTLHIEHFGRGIPVVFLHGWGMHGGMWGSVIDTLAQVCRVHVVDLPGYGQSQCLPLVDAHQQQDGVLGELDAIIRELDAQFNQPIIVCGWSLGGLIALRWAQRYPKKIERLILVASTPCFIQKPDWTCGMSIELLTAFSEALADNYLQTLRRFLALQVRGSEHERELLNQLRQGLERRGPPDMKALTSGLEMLRTCDFRSCLPEIPQSTLVIAGERDTLTPLLAAQFLSMTLPLAQLRVIHGAAHAPFLSHPERFVAHVKNFLYE